MNFFKIIFILLFTLINSLALADSHDQKQEVLDKVNEIAKELENEEEVPLNDPFAGDDGTASTIVSDVSSEKELVNLSKYKLVGVFNGTIKSFATFVDEGGEFITLEIQEELSNGLKLVDVNIKEAIFFIYNSLNKIKVYY